uniref:Uncharacterized protein n=1 Tax=Anguilla anguilla TaxID=7936 RepID=A0A0E9PHQ2_ANGAN
MKLQLTFKPKSNFKDIFHKILFRLQFHPTVARVHSQMKRGTVLQFVK